MTGEKTDHYTEFSISSLLGQGHMHILMKVDMLELNTYNLFLNQRQ